MARRTADPRPLFEQVAADLRRAINSGDLVPGAVIPAERDLAAKYRCSRDTIARAVRVLIGEGLVTSRRGRGGRIVRDADFLQWNLATFESPGRHTSESDAWATDVAAQGRTPSETVDLSIERASKFVATRLNLQIGARVVVRRRVRYVDGRPTQLADSFFPEDIAAGTPLMEPYSVAAPGGVLASAGYHQKRLRDEHLVRMPTAEETQKLQLPPGTAVDQVSRIGFAADGRPLRLMITIAPGDRNVMVYEMELS